MFAGAFNWFGDATSWLGDRADQLTGWADHWWYLAVILVIALLDAIIPIVPSETALIIGGVAVAGGDTPYSLWPVLLVGAVGAFLGDNASFGIGRHFAPRLERRAERRAKFAKRLEGARRQLSDRGGMLLITARFVPGGRTMVTLASGVTRQRRSWFVRWDALAATMWAVYAGGLAYLIGKPFHTHQTAALGTALGTSIVLNVVIEVVLRRRQRSRPSPLPGTPGEALTAAREQ
ncbi:MAG: DedA family protein [Ilumatobacteraceae bacterium]